APSIHDAKAALEDISNLLRPWRASGKGHKAFSGDDLLRRRLEMMKNMLWHYTRDIDRHTWQKASLDAAHAFDQGRTTAETIRGYCRAFITDRTDLPYNSYGTWNVSIMDDDELAAETHLHLQGVGKHRKAMDIVHFFQSPEIQDKYDLDGWAPSVATAQRWMDRMDYRWGVGPKGQYIDGHEREDVVTYRKDVFLPALSDIDDCLRVCNDDGTEIPYAGPRPMHRHLVIWFHDRRHTYWVHKDEKATPQPKGEGVSLMVVDFVSADHGFLGSDDAANSAHVY
ncbi:uncharacterized protein B0H18DRAFT_857820, partial [Fomitopsis serialis]|uniref:uncharacterized protein n=1 Tax=Fomitopsis serialis TaxID=139415 RepID=UPI002008E5A6